MQSQHLLFLHGKSMSITSKPRNRNNFTVICWYACANAVIVHKLDHAYNYTYKIVDSVTVYNCTNFPPDTFHTTIDMLFVEVHVYIYGRVSLYLHACSMFIYNS